MAEQGDLGSRDPCRDTGVIKCFQPCPVRLEAVVPQDRQRWLPLSLLGVPHTLKSLQGHHGHQVLLRAGGTTARPGSG